jgi:uncharacterized membrane protein YhaH (DUF805 family)
MLTTFVFLAISAVISFCLTIRRLHDINFNAYWMTMTIPLCFIAFVLEVKTGNDYFFELIMYYFACLGVFLAFYKGTSGPNKYGPPPEY